MPLSPQDIAARAEQIYLTRYKDEFEKNYRGQFAAIDVDTGRAFVGKTAEEALKTAEAAIQGGFFHLIRIGSPGFYHVSYVTPNGDKSLF